MTEGRGRRTEGRGFRDLGIEKHQRLYFDPGTLNLEL
jgi:hypothetical protein